MALFSNRLNTEETIYNVIRLMLGSFMRNKKTTKPTKNNTLYFKRLFSEVKFLQRAHSISVMVGNETSSLGAVSSQKLVWSGK